IDVTHDAPQQYGCNQGVVLADTLTLKSVTE
ncbi:hypothetical protein A2U01_0034977, partial [Trifolium medium]|nr:hypothetical protein [Trifolium medium]